MTLDRLALDSLRLNDLDDFVGLESWWRLICSTLGALDRAADSTNAVGNEGAGRVGVDLPRIERAVREMLAALGEDVTRDGLLDTPARVARSYRDLFAGLRDDPARHLARTFEQPFGQAVVLRDIEFSSLCEHHLLPFFGHAHIAYLPSDGRIVGLSKLARVVDGYARRPQVQERLTDQIADALAKRLQPRAVAVVVEAEHLCMRVRGVRKLGAVTFTTSFGGEYLADAAARAEIMALLKPRTNGS